MVSTSSSREIALAGVCAAALSLCACSTTEPSAARLDSVAPDVVSSRVDSAATLHGERFYGIVRADVDSDDPARADEQFSVAIGDVAIAADRVTLIDSRELAIIVPAGLSQGLHDVTLTTPGGDELLLEDGLRVLDDADLIVSIEDAAGGTGAPVDDRTIMVDATLDLYAVGRRASDGGFLFDITGDWTLDGTGTISDGGPGHVVFASSVVGSGVVSVTDALYGVDSTGTLSVVACIDNSDCLDPCRSTNQCIAGACVGAVDKDDDMDGFIDAMCPGGTDCDDDPLDCGAGCFPANMSPDICDGANQDCDAQLDEDPELLWYEDADSDSFGNSSVSQAACVQPGGFVADDTDCDDDPLGCGAGCFPLNPSADVCDGDNQDCDLQIDEDPELVWYEDADSDSFGNPLVTQNACAQPGGFVADATDCDDDPLDCGAGCFPLNPAADVCDGDNQDCDLQIDEDPDIIWYKDADSDSFGDPLQPLSACSAPGGFVADNTDCNDEPLECGASCFPLNPAADVCDGYNQDCDGATDEDPEIVWYQDADNDMFGDPSVSQNACAQPGGFVGDNTDCDDDPLDCGAGCFPSNPAADVCDGDNQDCDGATDEDPEIVWYRDADSDLFGDAAVTLNACSQPGGYVGNNTDCDDDPLDCGAGCFPFNPAADVCDGDNQDCDMQTDEDPDFVWYQDADDDLYGNASVALNACIQPGGYVSDATDCADTPVSDPACNGLAGNLCNPGLAGSDVCDGADNDCDVTVDEDPGCGTCFSCNAGSCVDDYSDEFAYRRPLIIDSSRVPSAICSTDYPGGNIPDFPVLVMITEPWLRTSAQDPVNGRIESATGDDIVFTALDGITELDHEIESYDDAIGALVAWVRIPALAYGTDTALFLYYGNTCVASPTESPTDVWDDGFVMVQHLDEDQKTVGTMNDHLDSTTNANDGEAEMLSTQMDGVGVIDGADDFDRASGDYIDLGGDGGSLDITGDITVSAWAKVTGSSGTQRPIVGKGDTQYMMRADNTNDAFTWFVHDGSWDECEADNPFVVGQWHYVVGRVDGSEVSLWVDGVVQSDIESGGISSNNAPVEIGRNSEVTSRLFDGSIDEVRISNVARPACWIETTFNSQRNPLKDLACTNNGFICLGNEAVIP